MSNHFFIEGPAGRLEAVIHLPSDNETKNVGIVCHPHPLYGGTMHNKVVTTIAKAFNACGIAAVCFNFRGIGKSEGQYGETIGERDDLFAVIRWVKENYSVHTFYLAGFSFGSFIAASAEKDLSLNKLILVAPPVERFNFSTLPEFKCEWIVVQGEQDEVVSAEAVFAWGESRKHAPQWIKFPDATHFFHGKLIPLREKLVECLK